VAEPNVVSSISVSLRPLLLSTPGRPQVGPQHVKQLVADLVRNARRGAAGVGPGWGGGRGRGEGAPALFGGSYIMAQSLEHLLLMMKVTDRNGWWLMYVTDVEWAADDDACD